jgi:hypothetical protein
MNVLDMNKAERIELGTRIGWKVWGRSELAHHQAHGAQELPTSSTELHIYYAVLRFDLVRRN